MRASMLLCAAGAMFSAVSAQAADYVSTVTATNPLAYFRLDAANQPSVVGGYTTTYTPTTGTGAGAPIGVAGNNAATFTGDNSNPSVVRTSLSGGIPGKGSINLWTNLSALPSTLGHFFALAGESEVNNDFDFQIQTDNRLYFYTGAGENTSYTFADPSALVGQWHMLTATYDATLGSDSFRNLYVDGIEVASIVGAGINGAAKTSQFNIGYNDVFTERDFAGSLDEVAVWNYGLSAEQVSTIYASRLDSAPSAAPEPSAWAMMVAGFGLIGATVRRRRAVRVSFA